MQQEYYLGIMSGTSLDGVDIALMAFGKNRNLLWHNSRQCPQICAKIYCN